MQKELNAMTVSCKKELDSCKDSRALNDVKVKYLGKSGAFTAVARGMKDVSAEDRPLMGKLINDTREEITRMIETTEKIIFDKELAEKLKTDTVDITLPSTKQRRGGLHPQTAVKKEIADIFLSMGYSIEDGPEVETEYYNFTALNVPQNHPARDVQDTFYFDDKFLLRSQTSTAQVHCMETGVLPIKMLNAGRVYRADEIDATHSPMFHQIEGLVVDKGLTLCDLKGTLEYFAKRLFGERTKTRFRPSYFPFTEPSIEVDASCYKCGGKGCRVCKGTGWIEIMGAGMVNVKVLEMSGIDSKVYSGFAFGMGLDRITNIKLGIDDLRVVFENDVNFLKQFTRC